MPDNKRLIWFKGKIIPVEDAKINVLAPTSQFGANVFEGLRCYWNDKKQQLYAFRLDEHFKRLLNSMKLIGFPEIYSKDFLKKAFLDVVRKNNYHQDIAVRQTIFLDGFGSWSSSEPIEMFIAPIPKERAYSKKRGGFSCCTSTWKRISDTSLSPKIKVGANYINSRMAQLEASKNGYDTAILLNEQGKVSEAPGSCIFIIRNNTLITPPITASILESITRQTIIEIAKNDLNLEVIERDIDRTELYISDEFFLCGTTIEIIPIFSLDKIKIGSGKLGVISKNLQELYFEIVKGNRKKYDSWLTPIY